MQKFMDSSRISYSCKRQVIENHILIYPRHPTFSQFNRDTAI